MIEFVLRDLPAGYVAAAFRRGDLTMVIADPSALKRMHALGRTEGPKDLINRVMALLETSPDPAKRVMLRLAS